MTDETILRFTVCDEGYNPDGRTNVFHSRDVQIYMFRKAHVISCTTSFTSHFCLLFVIQSGSVWFHSGVFVGDFSCDRDDRYSSASMHRNDGHSVFDSDFTLYPTDGLQKFVMNFLALFDPLDLAWIAIRRYAFSFLPTGKLGTSPVQGQRKAISKVLLSKGCSHPKFGGGFSATTGAGQ